MSTDNKAWPDIGFDYQGTQVLVTGGTSGIGAGIAAAYRAAGAEVIVTGTRASAADYEADLGGYRYLQLDVEDNAQIHAVAEALPQLDILVNNAGASPMGDDPDLFERLVRMHLTSAYRLSHACREKLAQSALPGGGSVIGIASMTSYFGQPVVPGYGAGKAGLVQMTKTLAIAWAELGIRVNAVACGLIDTPMTSLVVETEEMSAPMLERTPQRRFGTPGDVAGAVLFLTSSAAGFITGQTLPIDGGYSIVG